MREQLSRKRFSVEIECVLPKENEKKIKNELETYGIPYTGNFTRYCHGTVNEITLTSDSSIVIPYKRYTEDEDRYYDEETDEYTDIEYIGAELNIPLQSLQSYDWLKIVCMLLKKYDATVNKSCGLHVHIETVNYSLPDYRRIFKGYNYFQQSIDSMLPQSRRSMGLAAKLPPKSPTNLERVGKYTVVNFNYILSGHPHVEYRQHSGTIEIEKILNWVRILLILDEVCRNYNLIKSSLIVDLIYSAFKKTLINYQEYRDLTEYVIKRVRKFTGIELVLKG